MTTPYCFLYIFDSKVFGISAFNDVISSAISFWSDTPLPVSSESAMGSVGSLKLWT